MDKIKTNLFENADVINDSCVIKGIESGWLKMDTVAWNKYKKATERIKIVRHLNDVINYAKAYSKYFQPKQDRHLYLNPIDKLVYRFKNQAIKNIVHKKIQIKNFKTEEEKAAYLKGLNAAINAVSTLKFEEDQNES